MYKIDVDPGAREQMNAVPAKALVALAEVMAMLELTPWSGASQHKDNPDGAVRRVVFAGSGMVLYLILESQQRVAVLEVMWAG